MTIAVSLAVIGMWLLAIAFSSSVVSWLLVFAVLLNQGPLQWLELPTLVSRGVPEALVLALLLKVLSVRRSSGRPVRLVGILPVTGFVICLALSAITTSSGSVAALLFVRHTMVFYLMFITALNMDLNPRSYRIVTSLLILIALVQLPVALLKFAQFGIMEGGWVGTLPMHAGQLSTVMPLFVIAFLLAGYCWLGKSYLLALVPCFLAFGILGEKRAVAFFFPLVLVVVYSLWVYDRAGRRALLNQAGAFRMTLLAWIIAAMSFGGLYVAGRSLYSLNPEQRMGGRFDLLWAVQEMWDYTTGVNLAGEQYNDNINQSGGDLTTGRVSSTILTVTDLTISGPIVLALGRGPGLLIESALTEESLFESYMTVGIRGGKTGFVWMMQQVGLLGVVFFVALHAVLGYRLWKIYRRALSPGNKAIGLALISALFVFLLDFFAYSTMWITSGTVQPVWYFLTARHIDTYE